MLFPMSPSFFKQRVSAMTSKPVRDMPAEILKLNGAIKHLIPFLVSTESPKTIAHTIR